MTTIEAEDCWRTIQRLLERTSDHEVLAALAAGPLQLLIADAGPRFIDQIEHEARSNPAFRQLLTFVWDCTPIEVWAKVDAVRTVAAGRRMTSVHSE
ncbi:MAG: DUF6869 domain-containing protein [Ramlibacter sp.]